MIPGWGGWYRLGTIPATTRRSITPVPPAAVRRPGPTAIAEVPAFRGAGGSELLRRQAGADEPRLRLRLDDLVDRRAPLDALALGVLLPGLGRRLEEVPLQEGPAAEHAAGPAVLDRQLDLLLVIREVDAG